MGQFQEFSVSKRAQTCNIHTSFVAENKKENTSVPAKGYKDIWVFPKIGVPLNHSFFVGFSQQKPSSHGGTSISGNLHMFSFTKKKWAGNVWICDFLDVPGLRCFLKLWSLQTHKINWATAYLQGLLFEHGMRVGTCWHPGICLISEGDKFVARNLRHQDVSACKLHLS